MISYSRKKRMFYLRTAHFDYIFGINSEGYLYHAYFGKKLPAKKISAVKEPLIKEVPYHMADNRKSNYMPEINVYDGYNVFENTIKGSFDDGMRALDCAYFSHKIKGNMLNVILKDKLYGVKVVLKYLLYDRLGLMEKSLEIVNGRRAALNLESFNSGDLIFYPGKYNLGFFHGRWIKEMHMRFEEISHGKKVLESRTGNSSHILNPSFFLTKEDKVKEDDGEYYFCQLLWSGNWKFVFEKRMYDAVSFTGGINNFDGSIKLKPGKNFKAPPLLVGFTGKGVGDMSRRLHDYYRDHVIPRPNRDNEKRILVNSWEAFYFSVDSEKAMKLAEKAEQIGAEILVIDDGWFRERDNDGNSLGDWEPVKRKFPQGMAEFGRTIKKAGLKFGIWLEPEAVNTDSRLYRKHPDWCYHFKGRKRTEMRNTVILNILKPEVNKYLRRVIKRVIKEYDPDYVKWDMNRYISETGGKEAGDSTVWIEHMKAAYGLMAYMKALKPRLILEGCAGGGGRFSGGIFRYVDQMWTSDDNDPVERQYIQYGTSMFYPAQLMCNHVGDSPYGLTGRDTKLSFRLHTAMAGNLGTEANLPDWPGREIEIFRQGIETYKKARKAIFFGDLFRLESPYDGPRTSLLYISKDKKYGVLFAFIKEILYNYRNKTIKLKGLKAGYKYVLQRAGSQKIYTGKALMKKGIRISLNSYMDSEVILFRKV